MNNKQKLVSATALLGFALMKLGLLWWWQQQQSPVQSLKSCQIAEKSCIFSENASFRLHGVRTATTPFSAEVVGLSPNVQQVSVSFSMRDMDMGFNRFDFKKRPDASWRADNIRLPLCTAARHD